MGKDRVPPQEEKKEATAAERAVKLSETAESFLEEILSQVKVEAAKDGTQVATEPVTHSVGQVREIEIPAGWQQGRVREGVVGASSYREFRPAGQDDVCLAFFYRGIRTSEASGKSLHDVLAKPPHTLSAEEIQSLRTTLGEKSRPEDFTMRSAKTEEVNGKKVLVVEGRFKEIQEDTKALYIDSDGTGTAVQEVFYQAPAAQYQKYLPLAQKAIKSIEWR